MVVETRELVWSGLRISDPAQLGAPDWWVVSKVDPDLLGDAAPVATSGQRVQRDGLWRTRAFRGGLAGGLTGTVVSSTAEDSERCAAALRAAASIHPAPLTHYAALGPHTVFVVRDGPLSIHRISPTAFSWAAVVVADDPVWWAGGQTPDGRLDDSALSTYSLGLPALAGGLTWPTRHPLAFTEVGELGQVDIPDPGRARVTLAVHGPVADPVVAITDATGTRVLAWSLTLGAGERLEVDPVARRSLLQGQSSRPPWRREWPDQILGPASVLFRASLPSVAARLDVLVRPLT